jgi:hypothetical protein
MATIAIAGLPRPLTRQEQLEINFLARSRQLTTLDRLVLQIFVMTCDYTDKLYCWLAIDTILSRLSAWYRFPSSRRSVDRSIRRLRRLGLIRRKMRTKPVEYGKRTFTSSLTYLKGRLKDLIRQTGRLAQSLAQCFRTPSLAHYSFFPGKRSGWEASSKAPPPGPGGEKGSPAGTSSGHPPPLPCDEQLSYVQRLLKTLG